MTISFKMVEGRVIMRWNTYMLLLFSMITFPSSMPNPRSTLADSIVGSIRIEMFVEIFLYMKFSVSTGSWKTVSPVCFLFSPTIEPQLLLRSHLCEISRFSRRKVWNHFSIWVCFPLISETMGGETWEAVSFLGNKKEMEHKQIWVKIKEREKQTLLQVSLQHTCKVLENWLANTALK